MILLFFLAIQHIGAQSWQVQHFSALKSEGQSQIFDVFEDSRHYLWVGTAGGLLQYNGRTFTTHFPGEGIQSVYTVFEDQKKQLWIGTDEGIYRYDGREFTKFKLPYPVKDICGDRLGNLWIITPRQLFTFNGQQFEEYTADALFSASTELHHFFLDSKGQIWIATNDGLYQQSADSFRKYDEDDGLTGHDIRGISEDRNGNIWVATYRQGINVLIEGEFVRFAWSDLLADYGGLNYLYHDSKDRLWVATESNGLFIYDPVDESYKWLQNTDGLESNNVKTIFQDSQGRMWIGTSGGGLSSCQELNLPFLFFYKNPFFNDHSITALHTDAAGQMWVGTDKGLYKETRTGFDPFSESGFPKAYVTDIITFQNQLWVATEQSGILIYSAPHLIQLGAEQGLCSNHVSHLRADSTGHVYALSPRSGFSKIKISAADSLSKGYDINCYNNQPGQPAYLNDGFVDNWQRLWVTSSDRPLALIAQDSLFQSFGKSHALPEKALGAMAADTFGYLWIGSQREGVFRVNIYDDTLLAQQFNQQSGLTSDNITSVFIDRKGQLWLAHPSGLDRVLLNANRQITDIRFYGIADQFEGRLLSSEAITEDANGRLWFGTSEGLARYIPSDPRSRRAPPVPRLTRLLIQGTPIQETEMAASVDSWGTIKKPLILSSLQNDLLIEFESVNLDEDGLQQYQWKLTGQFDDWLPPSGNRLLNLTDLAPGKYTFFIRATSADGELVSPSLELPITVVPPFWQMLWFKLLAAGIIFILLVLFFTFRIRRIEMRASAIQKRLRAEKQLLLLEQKALALQMNPHFIFNALNSIQSQIGSQDARTARYQLAKFSKLMRRILENSRAMRISLEEEIELLEDYLALEQFSRGNTFDFQILTSESLDREEVYIPPMMIQPFVENAIIHGIAHLSCRGMIVINFRRESKQLVCSIEDNGIGRDAAAARKSQQEAQHKSAALEVTRERLNLLAGISTNRAFTILDLKDESGQAAGTKVLLHLPILQG